MNVNYAKKAPFLFLEFSLNIFLINITFYQTICYGKANVFCMYITKLSIIWNITDRKIKIYIIGTKKRQNKYSFSSIDVFQQYSVMGSWKNITITATSYILTTELIECFWQFQTSPWILLVYPMSQIFQPLTLIWRVIFPKRDVFGYIGIQIYKMTQVRYAIGEWSNCEIFRREWL